MILEIFREEDLLETVTIDENTLFVENFMADEAIVLDVTVNAPLTFRLDDYINYKGQRYSLQEPAEILKSNNQSYNYKARFESPLYSLYSEYVKHLGDITFSYLGTARDHLQLMIDNINEVDAGWSLGDVEITEPLNLDYDATYCRVALTDIAKAFNLEFKAVGKVITVVKEIGELLPLTFKYGMGNGLYTLNRKAVDDSGVVNRVYGFGGSRNIDYNYRGGMKRLVFEGRYLDAVTDFKTRVGKYENENIYPNRTGTVTAVTAFSETTQVFEIVDSSMDFDVNAYLMEGTPAKVSFKTGELTGFDFEIHAYDNATKKFKLKSFKDSNDYVLPNSTFDAAIGDTYTLIDINLPTSYVTTAEAKLEAETLAYLNQNKLPKVAYDLNNIDEIFMREGGITLNVAEKVTIQDAPLGINEILRINGISYPLVNPYSVKAIISNFNTYTLQEKIIAATISTQKEVRISSKTNAELARNNIRDLNELQNRIFNPDGTLSQTVTSIAAGMAKFGFDSQNFSLKDVHIVSNVLGDPNKLNISGGELVHYIYKIDDVGYQWTMTAASFTSLNPVKFYYVYAKCSQTLLTGTWEISETPVMVDKYPGYWCFNLGQLFEVNAEGYRSVRFTKGATFIVGDEITTGVVKDASGLNYFDLEQGKFKLGGGAAGLDWNVSSAGKLTIRGAIVASASGATDFIPVDRGVYSAAIGYYRGEVVKWTDDNYYMYINLSVDGAIGTLPSNTAYWKKTTQKGADGVKGASLLGRGVWSAGKTYSGTPAVIEAVKYGASWYMTKTTAGTITAGTLPTNTTYFDPFVGSFESVATDILFATLAYIENLGVENLKTSASGKRVEIDAANNNISIYDSSNNLIVQIDDDAGYLGAGGVRVYATDGSGITGRFGAGGIAIGESEMKRDALFLFGELFMSPNPSTGKPTTIRIFDGLATTYTGFTGTRGGYHYQNGIMTT